jgi:hypothetical protein
MGGLNSDISLFEALRVEGREPIRIPPEELDKSRQEFIAACEESDREERACMADAVEKVSRIYLTF